ncbi:MAG: tRNA (adenosine(37)-N6)-dimethylallyltransferase MiaA [Gammaproteobacteria bacterium]|nr:MAG: tRNA (adenosine(37)-N6)-dimethylallyltransferase MiaA [Gammaproteobacteria bacterium]
MDGVKPAVILLMGPTACGKTDLAIRLCADLPCDLVSVDSAMVYRGMDIGTAKPSADTLSRCPHRLVDICDPEETYSAGRFVDDATREIESIIRRERVPLLVGGTMLYFRSLQMGMASLPKADPAIRGTIDEQAGRVGWPAMHDQLRRLDPDAAAKIRPNDRQRIQRALEVIRISGRPISQLHAEGAVPERPWEFVKIGLWPPDRAQLRARIDQRFRKMLATGLEQEVAALKRRPGLTAEHSSMRAVGYRQVWAWLAGQYGREEAISRAVTATAQLAKRQLTWLRREQGLRRFDPTRADLTAVVLDDIRKTGLVGRRLC